MTNKLKIQNITSGRVGTTLAFVILATGLTLGSWVCVYGFGHTRQINPDTGRPHGEQPINNTYDAGKVDARGITLEPTKMLKREVVPAVEYPAHDANVSVNAPVQGKPITVSTPVHARTQTDKTVSADAKPAPKVTSETQPAVKPVVKPAAKPVVKPAAKPVVKPAAKPVVKTETRTVAVPETAITDPANTKPAISPAPVKDAVDIALSELKSEETSSDSDAKTTDAQAVSRKKSSVAGSPADEAVEWAMSGWKTIVVAQQSRKQSSQVKAKTWSVARAVGEKNDSEPAPAQAKPQSSVDQSQAPVPSPFPAASVPATKPVSEKSGREAFLTQTPKPIPRSLRSGSTPSPQAKPSGPSSAPAVNYGGKLEGIESTPNDIVLTDAIVEIPKGEGFEAMISACGQGLLVELGIEELDKEGKPVLDSTGKPKRISLKRGMAVRKGQILGKQNDREHAANKLVAEQQLIVAKKEAEKQLEVEVARFAVQVAESEYLRAQTANEKVSGAVSPQEVIQKAYEWKRAEKSAEKAVYDLGVKADEVEVRKAQVLAADAQVVDRKLVSPIDGFVDDLMQNEGQWLREGDNILKIIRLDKVQICGKIDANSFSPEMVDRKPVTIYVQKPGGGPLQKVQGIITYARQVVESGKFYIYAEANNVANAQGYWLLNPGTIVTMVIHR